MKCVDMGLLSSYVLVTFILSFDNTLIFSYRALIGGGKINIQKLRRVSKKKKEGKLPFKRVKI